MNNKKIVLFGAGEIGKTIATQRISCKLPIEFFVDNNSSLWGTTFNEIPIYSPDTLLNLNSNTVILLTANPNNIITITIQLEKMGLVKNNNFYVSYYEYCADTWAKQTFHKCEKVRVVYGTSAKGKYLVKDESENDFFLVIHNTIDILPKVSAESKILSTMAPLDIGVPKIVDFGKVYSWGVYVLYEYIQGSNLFDVLACKNEKCQYELGIKAGRMLKKIHALPIFKEGTDWVRLYSKTLINTTYELFNTKTEVADFFYQYAKSNKHIVTNRPMSFVHGDYSCGNLIATNENNLFCVDFDGLGYGDIYMDLARLANTAASEASFFSIGGLHGYFEGEPPNDFWISMKFYSSVYAMQTLLALLNKTILTPEIEKYYATIKNNLYQWIKSKKLIPEWYCDVKENISNF